MSAITKPEWRRRCIAHLRQHGAQPAHRHQAQFVGAAAGFHGPQYAQIEVTK